MCSIEWSKKDTSIFIELFEVIVSGKLNVKNIRIKF